MLVHKRRLGQGVIFDGRLRVTVLELAPEVWLSIESQSAGIAPVICSLASQTKGMVCLGVRSPTSLAIRDDGTTVITTDSTSDPESQLIVARRPRETVEIDGISIVLAELEGGEHNGKPLLHITAPGIEEVVDLAVLTRYNYAVDIATAAPQSIRIYRTEVWTPAADANESAASWSNDEVLGLQRQSAKTS